MVPWASLILSSPVPYPRPLPCKVLIGPKMAKRKSPHWKTCLQKGGDTGGQGNSREFAWV